MGLKELPIEGDECSEDEEDLVCLPLKKKRNYDATRKF